MTVEKRSIETATDNIWAIERVRKVIVPLQNARKAHDGSIWIRDTAVEDKR